MKIQFEGENAVSASDRPRRYVTAACTVVVVNFTRTMSLLLVLSLLLI